MENPDVQALIEEATFQYTLGEDAQALELIGKALELDPNSFAAWHAKTEVHFSARELDSALEAGKKRMRSNLRTSISIPHSRGYGLKRGTKPRQSTTMRRLECSGGRAK